MVVVCAVLCAVQCVCVICTFALWVVCEVCGMYVCGVLWVCCTWRASGGVCVCVCGCVFVLCVLPMKTTASREAERWLRRKFLPNTILARFSHFFQVFLLNVIFTAQT